MRTYALSKEKESALFPHFERARDETRERRACVYRAPLALCQACYDDQSTQKQFYDESCYPLVESAAPAPRDAHSSETAREERAPLFLEREEGGRAEFSLSLSRKSRERTNPSPAERTRIVHGRGDRERGFRCSLEKRKSAFFQRNGTFNFLGRCWRDSTGRSLRTVRRGAARRGRCRDPIIPRSCRSRRRKRKHADVRGRHRGSLVDMLLASFLENTESRRARGANAGAA